MAPSDRNEGRFPLHPTRPILVALAGVPDARGERADDNAQRPLFLGEAVFRLFRRATPNRGATYRGPIFMGSIRSDPKRLFCIALGNFALTVLAYKAPLFTVPG